MIMTRYLIFIIVLGACSKPYMPPTPTPEKPVAKVQEAKKQETPIKISALNLGCSYSADPKKADSLYKGKILDVRGRVVRTQCCFRGDGVHLYMRTYCTPAIFTFKRSALPWALKVQRKTIVTLRCRCDGVESGVIGLSLCEPI
jgi:hypothetical protein